EKSLLGRQGSVSVRAMCGIVGLFSKSQAVEERLGAHVGAMLAQLSDRGPDSAGLAVYRDPAAAGSTKLTLWSADPAYPWDELAAALGGSSGGEPTPAVLASHAVLTVDASADETVAWLRRERPDVRVMSAGAVIEIYKEMGRPERFVERFDLP